MEPSQEASHRYGSRYKDMEQQVIEHFDLHYTGDNLQDELRHRLVTVLSSAAFWASEAYGLVAIDDLTVPITQDYLYSMTMADLSQEHIDYSHEVLSVCIGELDPVFSRHGTEPSASLSRYIYPMVFAICEEQNRGAAICTSIAYTSGVADVELFSLCRLDDTPHDVGYLQRPDLFTGMQGERYTTMNKEGQVRQVMLDSGVANGLEMNYALDEPRVVFDRGISYQQRYGLPCAGKWEKSFVRASKRAVGWCFGIAGLRHTYACDRMEHLLTHDYDKKSAVDLVSVEMGLHCREVCDLLSR